MDRQISPQKQSSAKSKKLLQIAIGIIILIIAYLGFRKVITKTADASTLRITSVERGDIRSTLSASGTVIAAAEQVINASVSTEIEKVHLRSGASVQKGDAIMHLDQQYTRLEYEQLQDQLALRKNNIEKLALEYDKNLRDIVYQDQIKGLQLEQLAAQLKDQKRLLTVGGATAEEVESATLQLKIAKIEKQQLENELAYRKAVNGTEKQNLQLEYDIQAKQLSELRNKLKETKVIAPVAGVITWINEDIGKTVLEGEPLVKIANLDRYRVEGQTSDRNSHKLQVGLPVEVRIGKERLRGSITRVLPEIENSTAKFYVDLDDETNKALRPNLRTELYIITDKKTDVLRAKRGNALKGTKSQHVYKVTGSTANKVRITKGLVSNDYFEIESGLDVGDRIIISDTKEMEHMDQFEITD